MPDWRWPLQSPQRLAGTVVGVLLLVAVLGRLLSGGSSPARQPAAAGPAATAVTGAPSPSALSSRSPRPAPSSSRGTGPATPTPTVAAGPVLTHPAQPDAAAVAARYLAAREGAVSWTHANSRDWLAEVQPLMTPAGWARLSATAGDSGGYPAATARQHRWAIRAQVACVRNDEAGRTPTAMTLSCSVTDTTVTATGTAVASSDLPGLWPLTGAQPLAVLSLVNAGGRWLVDADQSGQAG